MFDKVDSQSPTPLSLKSWLPKVTHDGFAPWAERLRDPVSISLVIGDRLLQADPLGPTPSGYFLRLSAQVPDGNADLFVPLKLLTSLPPPWAALMDTVHFGKKPIGLNTKMVPLIAEHILGSVLQHLDLEIDKAEATIVSNRDVCGATLKLFRNEPAPSHTIYLDLSESLSVRFTPERPHRRSHFAHLELKLALCALGFWISQKDLANLQCGDTLDCTSAISPTLFAKVGGHTVDLNKASDTWETSGKLVSIDYPQTRLDRLMKDTFELENLSVLLTFELDKKSITLSDLQKQTVGSFFDISNLDDAKISICANGTPIGEGRMVQFDDRLAVQILKLDSHV